LIRAVFQDETPGGLLRGGRQGEKYCRRDTQRNNSRPELGSKHWAAPLSRYALVIQSWMRGIVIVQLEMRLVSGRGFAAPIAWVTPSTLHRRILASFLRLRLPAR